MQTSDDSYLRKSHQYKLSSARLHILYTLRTLTPFPQKGQHLKTERLKLLDRTSTGTQSWCGQMAEGQELQQSLCSHIWAIFKTPTTKFTKTLPASGRLVSRIMGDVRVMVHDGLGSFSAVTMIAASSTQRFTSYLSSVTVCNNRQWTYDQVYKISF